VSRGSRASTLSSPTQSTLEREALRRRGLGRRRGQLLGHGLQQGSIFAKYNLSVPKTFDDFEKVCATLKQNGITPVYEPVSDGWHHVLWFPEVGAQLEALEPGLNAKLNANQATFAGDANMP
jgi:hypothetical protein